MAIFGADDRVEIPHDLIDDTPFKAVVTMKTTYSNGSVTFGTGAMIGPDDVLTAGHCVYSQENGWATNISVWAGYDPSGYYTAYSEAEDSMSVNGWVNQASFDWDYAYIDLKTNIGFSTGWFEISSGGNVNDIVESLGYPGDYGSVQQIYTTGTIDAIEGQIFKFTDDLDAMPGQSGSPVFSSDRIGNVDLVGIVSHEQYWPVGQNGVLRLTDNIVDQINDWAGMAPTVRFDEGYYLERNLDVAAAVKNGWFDAEYHYDHYGWREGRDPCDGFDTSFYLAANPDVAAAGVNPLQHFLLHGQIEGRNPDFNTNHIDESNYLINMAAQTYNVELAGVQTTEDNEKGLPD